MQIRRTIKTILTVFFLEFVVGFFIQLHAAEYYVNPNDSTKYQTINAALQDTDNIKPGDTIYIKGGTYFEEVVPTVNGSLERRIYIKNAPGETVVIDGEEIRLSCLRIANVKHLYFSGIIFEHAKSEGVKIADGSEDITLDNVVIRDNTDFTVEVKNDKTYVWGASGIFINTDSGGLVKNCKIVNSQILRSAWKGIYLLGNLQDITIENNTVSYVGYYGGVVEVPDADGIYVVGTWNKPPDPVVVTKRVFLYNNIVEHATRQGIVTWYAHELVVAGNICRNNGATGIQIEDNTKYFVVADNVSYSNQKFREGETGIWIDDSQYGLVKGNLMYDNVIGLYISKSSYIIARNNVIHNNHRIFKTSTFNNGIYLHAYGDTPLRGVRVFNNSVYDIGDPMADPGVYYYNSGLRVIAEMNPDNPAKITDTVIYNNIFSHLDPGYVINILFDPVVSEFTSNYNMYHLLSGNSNPPVIMNAPEGKYETKSFNYYKANTGREINSLIGDPMFLNGYQEDSHLPELDHRSPAIDKGVFLTFTSTDGANSNVVVVEDAAFFTDGYGLYPGDIIRIGNHDSLGIVSVDYNAKQLTLDKKIDWRAGDHVSFPFTGAKPDIGALEYGLVKNQVTSTLIE